MGSMCVYDVSARHGKIYMNHSDLMKEINKRLDETDRKIDRNETKLDELKDDLHSYNLKTVVLETQMTGVVKFILLLIGSVSGIVTYIIKKGIL